MTFNDLPWGQNYGNNVHTLSKLLNCILGTGTISGRTLICHRWTVNTESKNVTHLQIHTYKEYAWLCSSVYWAPVVLLCVEQEILPQG